MTTLTGPASAPVQGETFYPWGQRWATAGSLQEEHFAAFHQRDPGTGLDYTLNRMYTSTQGRWLTPDPGGTKVVSLEDPQTWNMYSYVRDTPLASTDPLGLEPGEQPDEKKVQGHEPATHDDNQGPGKDPEKNPAKMKHDEHQGQQLAQAGAAAIALSPTVEGAGATAATTTAEAATGSLATLPLAPAAALVGSAALLITNVTSTLIENARGERTALGHRVRGRCRERSRAGNGKGTR